MAPIVEKHRWAGIRKDRENISQEPGYWAHLDLIIAKVLQSHELRLTSKVELCLLQTDPLTTDLQLISTTDDQVAGSDLEVG